MTFDPAASNRARNPSIAGIEKNPFEPKPQLQTDWYAPGVTGKAPRVGPARYTDPLPSTAIAFELVSAAEKNVEYPSVPSALSLKTKLEPLSCRGPGCGAVDKKAPLVTGKSEEKVNPVTYTFPIASTA